MRLTSEIEVDFKRDTHQYFRHGNEYISQSAFVKIFEPMFDKNIVHHSARAAGISSEAMQSQWDKKRDDAGEYGTEVHDVIEGSWYGKTVPGKYVEMIDSVRILIQPSKVQFPEKILYLDAANIAGTADLPSERTVFKGQQVVDIFDYKTNRAKGITLYSSKFKDGKWAHYGESRFLGPISHLEYTLYNKYALQISLYMYMVQHNYHALAGRLGILYIDSALRVSLIPVPYMKYEIEAMINYYLEMKNNGLNIPS
jgi:hypothetical protein